MAAQDRQAKEYDVSLDFDRRLVLQSQDQATATATDLGSGSTTFNPGHGYSGVEGINGGRKLESRPFNDTVSTGTSDRLKRTDLYNTTAVPIGADVRASQAGPSSTEGAPHRTQTVEQVSTEDGASAGWSREPLVMEGLEGEGKASQLRTSSIVRDRDREPVCGRVVDSLSFSGSVSLSSTSSQQESEASQSEASSSLTPSMRYALGYDASMTPSMVSSVGGSLTNVQMKELGRGGRAYEAIADGGNEPDGEQRPRSPFLVVGKSDVADASKFESPGYLYARSAKRDHNRDLLQPADEVAEDVLEAFRDSVHEEVVQRKTSVGVKGAGGGGAEGGGAEGGRQGEEELTDSGGWDDVEQSLLKSEGGASVVSEYQQFRSRKYSHVPPPIDPGVLLDLETDAQKLAVSLAYTMDNLRNSLHAMTVCSQQSMQLHRESVDNLHSTVDANVKAMYTFMAKFEELNKNIGPVQEIAAQIRELNENLTVLERHFRTQ